MKDSFGYEVKKVAVFSKGFFKCPLCKQDGLTAAGVRQHFCPVLRKDGEERRLPGGQIERILKNGS